MSENKRRRNAKPKYPMEVVRAVIYDVQTTTLTLEQIGRKYGMPKGCSALISRWVRKYSADFEQMNKSIPISVHQPGSTSIKGATENEAALQRALQEAQMKIICLETLIDIAEKELNVPIRKKSGTKQ
jgi:hypothetical protein